MRPFIMARIDKRTNSEGIHKRIASTSTKVLLSLQFRHYRHCSFHLVIECRDINRLNKFLTSSSSRFSFPVLFKYFMKHKFTVLNWEEEFSWETRQRWLWRAPASTCFLPRGQSSYAGDEPPRPATHPLSPPSTSPRWPSATHLGRHPLSLRWPVHAARRLTASTGVCSHLAGDPFNRLGPLRNLRGRPASGVNLAGLGRESLFAIIAR